MAAQPSSADADQRIDQPPGPTNGTSRVDTKPITVMLADELLKKLKIIAVVRETSVSDLVAEAAAGVVRRELRKALARISEE